MKKIFLLILLLPIIIISYSQNENILLPDGKYCHEVIYDSISKNKFYIPLNIDECNIELDKILGTQPKQLLIEARDVELKRIYGMYIFSEWTERESTRLCCYFRTRGIDDFQDRDYLILLAYKRHLLKQPFDIDKECCKIVQYHDSIAKERKLKYERDIVLDSINGIYIPLNLEDCLSSLDHLLNDTIKLEISKADSSSNFHFGLGMWLRNNWRLWGGSRLQLWFNTQGIIHPDNMSGIVLSVYQEYLQKGSINVPQKMEDIKKEIEIFTRKMDESNSISSFEFNEEDFYSDKYKDFLGNRYINNIFISR